MFGVPFDGDTISPPDVRLSALPHIELWLTIRSLIVTLLLQWPILLFPIKTRGACFGTLRP